MKSEKLLKRSLNNSSENAFNFIGGSKSISDQNSAKKLRLAGAQNQHQHHRQLEDAFDKPAIIDNNSSSLFALRPDLLNKAEELNVSSAVDVTDVIETARNNFCANNIANITPKATMLSEASSTRGATSNGTTATTATNGAALHLLASGPLFGNLNNASTTMSSAAANTASPLVQFPTTAPNEHHYHLSAQQNASAPNQILAALTQIAASRNAAAASSQQQLQSQQHQTDIALQTLFVHANGMPPFGIYPPPGIRPNLTGPMPPNFLFDGIAGNAFHPYGMETGRRKNATREVTQPLKAWLETHHRNPYPTKAEKTVLAIITKMNLTQVSTWFANARRRLKKDNKMTWSPRNSRNADEDDEYDGEDGEERPNSTLSNLSDGVSKRDCSSENANQNCRINPTCSNAYLFNAVEKQAATDAHKKIWSIADTINNTASQPHQRTPPVKTPSTCSSTDDLKTEQRCLDMPLLSDKSSGGSNLAPSSKALAAMTSAFMAANNGAAAAAPLDYGRLAGVFSINGSNAITGEKLGSKLGVSPLQMSSMNTLHSLAQHQQGIFQQQMMANPLLAAFISQQQQRQNEQQYSMQQHQHHQQHQQMLLMVAAAAAAAAAMKNPLANASATRAPTAVPMETASGSSVLEEPQKHGNSGSASPSSYSEMANPPANTSAELLASDATAQQPDVTSSSQQDRSDLMERVVDRPNCSPSTEKRISHRRDNFDVRNAVQENDGGTVAADRYNIMNKRLP